MKTLLIFDIDGTLLHSNRIDSECFATTYQRIYNRPFPSINWSDYPHVTDTTIFGSVIQDQFGRAVDPEEAETFKLAFEQLLLERRSVAPADFMEVPGARATVERFVEQDNMVLGIATGGWERPAMVKLRHIGIPTNTLYMSFADGKIRREDILQSTIDQAKGEHGDIERIVYVGDALWDVRTTRNMRLPLIGIRRKGDHEFLVDAGTSHVFSNYLKQDQFEEAIRMALVPTNATKV